MKSYDTKARTALSEYLRSHDKEQFTAKELAEIMSPVAGKSTVYRILTKLCEDGNIRRLARGEERVSYYQALPDDRCLGHLHLKCTECGYLVHLDEAASRRIFGIALANSFEIDTKMTMLYGRCEKCRG